MKVVQEMCRLREGVRGLLSATNSALALFAIAGGLSALVLFIFVLWEAIKFSAKGGF